MLNLRLSSVSLAAAVVLGQIAIVGAIAFSPRQQESPVRLSRKELEIYSHGKTLIDWTPREIKHSSSLHHLYPAVNQDKLPMILERVGKTGGAMLADFRNIVCDEQVYSEWTVGKHLPAYRGVGPSEASRSFRYIIIPTHSGDPRIFKEYRTSPGGRPIDFMNLSGFQMITSNFAGSWAYLNSPNQRESRFRFFGQERFRKKECYVVGFAQIPSIAQTVSTVEVDYHSYALLVQGLAWIEKKSFHIMRIETWLLAPRPDIGLESQVTTVDYFPVQPAGVQELLWLPKKVTVLVHFNGTFIRNTHEYSRFKLFRVGSTIKP